MIKEDSDGIKGGILLTASGSLVDDNQHYFDDVYVQDDTSNITNQDDAGLRALEDKVLCTQATDTKTYVLVFSVPENLTMGSQISEDPSQADLNGTYPRYPKWGIYKGDNDSDGKGTGFGIKMHMLLQDTQADYKKLQFLFNSKRNIQSL